MAFQPFDFERTAQSQHTAQSQRTAQSQHTAQSQRTTQSQHTAQSQCTTQSQHTAQSQIILMPLGATTPTLNRNSPNLLRSPNDLCLREKNLSFNNTCIYII